MTEKNSKVNYNIDGETGRKVFYVDVGNISEEKATEILLKFKQEVSFRNKTQIVSADEYNQLAAYEKEFWAELDKPTCSFSVALNLLKKGKKVARRGWNGKGMFLFLVPGSTFKVNRPPLLGIYSEGTEIKYHSHIDMKTADDQVVPWLASQTDMLAEDWLIVI